MDRRDFLKGAAAALAAGAALPAVGSVPVKIESEPERRTRPQHTRHAVYPLQTDFAGLQLMDPEAARKYEDGWFDHCGPDYPGAISDTGELNRDAFLKFLKENNVTFAHTKMGGWDLNGERSPLGYNPVQRYWTFYEYDEMDGYDIFGRGPRNMGYEPSDPNICWHFTREDAEKHQKHCEEHPRKHHHPEVHLL